MKKLLEKRTINKKSVRPIIYAIVALFAISFATYPSTNSLFKKENDNSLVYNSNLEETFKGELSLTLNPKSSTHEEISLTININRDKRYISENDSYILEGISTLNNEEVSCSIEPSSRSANLNVTNNIITFKNKNSESGTIDLKCNIKKNIDQKAPIDILVNLYESVNNETKFLYESNIYTIAYKDYIIEVEKANSEYKIC